MAHQFLILCTVSNRVRFARTQANGQPYRCLESARQSPLKEFLNDRTSLSFPMFRRERRAVARLPSLKRILPNVMLRLTPLNDGVMP